MSDELYLSIILKRLYTCKSYQPKFGQGGEGLSWEGFRDLYGADSFYSWFGLDHPLMYAAHKAAGGITSVYRQIGTGCEELFLRILMDQFGLDQQQVQWSYTLKRPDGSLRVLSLDGKLALSDIQDDWRRGQITQWLRDAAASLEIAPEITAVLKGIVFEVRQGYKSKDSKRQNADIANAAAAYSQGYLPVVLVLSAQIDSDVIYRYRLQKWLVLTGNRTSSNLQSTYAFMRDNVGYDLSAFFERNADRLRTEVTSVLETLLKTDD